MRGPMRAMTSATFGALALAGFAATPEMPEIAETQALIERLA